MFKAMFWIVLLLGVITLWKRHEAKVSSIPHWGSGTVVIEFADPNDLLAQLRRVKTGQKVELRGSPGQSVATGVACSDKAGVAAYMAQANKEQEQLSQAIEAELKRIQQVP